MSIEYPDECFLQSGIPCDCCRVSGREIQKMYEELTEARAEIERLTAELNRLRDPARVDAGYDLLDQLAEIEMARWGREGEA